MSTKIKVFRFRVSNEASYCSSTDKKEAWYQREIANIISPEEIERTVNQFTSDRTVVSEVIDIRITTIDVHHGGKHGNTVDLIYTIIYR